MGVTTGAESGFSKYDVRVRDSARWVCQGEVTALAFTIGNARLETPN